MPPLSVTVRDEEALQPIAAALGALLRRGDVVTLTGELGAGKTAFCRALINSLGAGGEEVPSPTFTLVQVYDAQQPEIWHFDLYRLENENDILELGWEDARRHAAVLVEWPQRLGGLLPRDRLEISITFDKDLATARRLDIAAQGSWQARLDALATAPDFKDLNKETTP